VCVFLSIETGSNAPSLYEYHIKTKSQELMNNMMLSYLAFVLVVGIGSILLIISLHRIQRRKRFDQEADARGWRYEDTSRLGSPSCRFSGTAGGNVAWTAECIASSTGDEMSSTTYHTRWWTQATFLPDRLVLIGPRMPVVGTLPATLQGAGWAARSSEPFCARYSATTPTDWAA
jgi:hypothetical protein